MSFEEFIRLHEGDDPARLVLARDRWPEVDVALAVTTLQARAKLKAKVPEWYEVTSLCYPSVLSVEQCSSAVTARYKARLAAAFASRFASGGGLADLTGGLGVDSWAFSEVFPQVLYNEADTALSEATKHNFGLLGLSDRIQVHAERIAPKGSPEGCLVAEVLGHFSPAVLYLDPARRDAGGRKVFRLQDCSPDVLALMPELLEAAPIVLLKLSPMMDITLGVKELNASARGLGSVARVDVVASGGECKELLVSLLRNGYIEPEPSGAYSQASPRIVATELDGPAASFSFYQEEESVSAPILMEREPSAEGFLFEPGKALLKAGAFNLICRRFGLMKWGIHTHLYWAPEPPEDLLSMGKWYRIHEILPLGNRTFRDIGKRFPQAEVTTRNLPLSADDFRRKSGCTPGGDRHLYALRADFIARPSANLLLITSKR